MKIIKEALGKIVDCPRAFLRTNLGNYGEVRMTDLYDSQLFVRSVRTGVLASVGTQAWLNGNVPVVVGTLVLGAMSIVDTVNAAMAEPTDNEKDIS